MDEEKKKCDLCGSDKDVSKSENLQKNLCSDCWDEYGEMCHFGLA